MEPPHFGDFSLAFGQIQELPDHPASSAFNDHSANDFVLHSAVPPASVSGANVNALTTGQSSSFVVDSSAFATADAFDSAPDHYPPPLQRHSSRHNSAGAENNSDFSAHSQGLANGTDLGQSRNDKIKTPAWSELKTKAGKDRKRLPLACIACRRKKIRCSGEKPACKHCLRSRTPCVYKVTSRKAAPRTDYMAMLDKRLKRMEERIIKIVPKSDQESIPSVTRAVVKPAIPGTNASKATASRKRRADDAFSPDLEAWANTPSKSKIGENNAAPIVLDREEMEDSNHSSEGLDSLPPKDLQEHLAEVFFDSVYGQAYHLLHKPSFMRKLKANTLPPVLVLSVCAVSARFSTNPKLPATSRPFLRGEDWAKCAREICTRRYEWPNITILTCLLILGLHEFGTCHGGRSWALGGQAIRMAYALQLHKDLDLDPQHGKRQKLPLSFIDREIRRRIMWACFLMDRFTSSGTGRPMFITDDSLMIPLPVGERFFQFDMPVQTEMLNGKPGPPAAEGATIDDNLQANMGPSAFFIRSLALWGRIVAYHHHGGREQEQLRIWDNSSQLTKLIQESEEFSRNLPPTLQYSRENLELYITERTAAQYLFLHLTIFQNILYVCQAALCIKHDNPAEASKDFIPKLTAKMFQAANSISQLLKDSEERQCFVTAPFAGYCAFSSSSVQIYGMVSGNSKLKAAAESHLAVNIKYLQKMMKYWGMFHWTVEDIRRQYKTAYDASRRGASGAANVNTQPQIQPADWFSRYPLGLFNDESMESSQRQQPEMTEDAVLEQKAELHSVEDFLTNLSPATPTTDGKDASKTPAPKRVASVSRKNPVSTNSPAISDQPTTETRQASGTVTSRRATEPHLGVSRLQADQRNFSSPATTQQQMAFNTLSIPPQPQGYLSSVSPPLSSNSITPFSSQPQMPFFADIVPLGIGNGQEAGMQQQMFGIVAGGVNAPEDNNNAAWQSLPSGGQLNSGRNNGPMPKNEGGSVPQSRQALQQQNPMTAPTMNIFNSAPDCNWFMGYDMEQGEVNQNLNMTSNGMEGYGMFGGGNNIQ